MRMVDVIPEQYKTGKVYFYQSEFLVNENVFIPRPETEILVETVVELVGGYTVGGSRLVIDILDLGTGSGNIAISLTKSLLSSKITACDISRRALAVAEKNASLHGVAEQIQFVVSDLFGGFAHQVFDIIASNPPYVAGKEFDSLPQEVLAEPRIALYGGIDGLYFIRRIIQECPRYLKQGGYLVMEIGYNQSRATKQILGDSRKLKLIQIKKDYQGIDRILVAKRHG